MGAVELLVAVEAIDLLRRQDFFEPSLKDIGAGHRPFRALHFSLGAVARHFPNPKVDVGMDVIMGDVNDLFEAWRAICSGLGPSAFNRPRSS